MTFEPRDPDTLIYSGSRMTLKELAKESAILLKNPIDPRGENFLKRLYYGAKRAIIELIPASYYHKKREECSETIIKVVFSAFSINSIKANNLANKTLRKVKQKIGFNL